MPTCVFQGNVNIPIYQAPYSITEPTLVNQMGGTGLALSTCCDTAMAGWGVLDMRPGGYVSRNNPSVLMRGTFIRLNPTSATIMKINGGFSPPVGSVEYRVMAVDAWNMLTTDGEQLIYANGGALNVYTTMPTMRPFISGNFPSPNYYYGPGSAVGSVGLTDVGGQGTGGIGSGGGKALIRNLSNPGAFIRGYLRTYNWGSDFVSVPSIPFNYPNNFQWPELNNWYDWGTNQPTTTFYIPDFPTVSNFVWMSNANQQVMNVANLIVNYPDVSNGFTFVATPLSPLVFDDSNLNTYLANAGNTPKFSAVSNGIIFGLAPAYSPSGQAIDYFISKDGTKYWRLSYLPQGPFTINGQITDALTNQPTRYVDINGTFWYTGAGATVGGTVTPLYSTGFYANFNPVIVPSANAITFPCWSSCVDQDNPWTNIYEV